MTGRQRGRQVPSAQRQFIEVNDEDLEITIKGEAKEFFGRDLLTRGIATLITGADTHGWEKEHLEGKGDKSPTEQFYAAVLTAVAERYRDDMTEFTDEEYTVDQALSLLIDQLRSTGYLQNSASGAKDSKD